MASDVRVAGDGMATRMVVDFSQKIDMRVFTLANPYRVVIDLPQVTFNLPPKTGESGRGLIKAFRFGLMMTGGSRIVIDTTAAGARRKNRCVLDAANDSQPAIGWCSISPRSTADLFMRAVALESGLRAGAVVGGRGQPSRKPSRRDLRPIIVLDPGHGGIDNGTQGGRAARPRRPIVLEFTQLLRDKIEKAGKYHVVMTRSDDTFVALADRVPLRALAATGSPVHLDPLRRAAARRGRR